MNSYEIDRRTNYIDTITPTLNDLLKSSGYNLFYHWKLPDNRDIFLYIFLNEKVDENGNSYIEAKSNLDSQDVRGQGRHLWNFLLKTLSYIAKHGYKGLASQPVQHIANPNEFALEIVKNSPGYTEKNGGFCKIYSGNEDIS